MENPKVLVKVQISLDLIVLDWHNIPFIREHIKQLLVQLQHNIMITIVIMLHTVVINQVIWYFSVIQSIMLVLYRHMVVWSMHLNPVLKFVKKIFGVIIFLMLLDVGKFFFLFMFTFVCTKNRWPKKKLLKNAPINKRYN